MPPHWLQKCMIRSVLVEKNIWGYKKLQGAPKTYKGAKSKKSGDLFVVVFWRQ